MAWADQLDPAALEALLPRITEGYLKKFLDRHVFLRQASIRDETHTVANRLAQTASKVGEKIVIRRFVRRKLETAQPA